MTQQKNKRWCYLSTYNRLQTIKEIRKMLAEEGATVLIPAYYEIYEMEIMTRDDDADKVKKLKESCKNIKCLRGSCGEGLSLDFIKDNFYYHIEYDENPFMPITYNKIKIDADGNYTGARYCYSSEDLNDRSWAKNKTLCFSFGYDEFFKICDTPTIKECASYHLEQIKKELIKGPESANYIDNYHPRNAVYNIFNYKNNKYENKRPMTAQELKRGF